VSSIRSIKPEFWSSEQIAECSTNARLTFVGLWTFSDDNGVHPAKPKTLNAKLYPFDSFTAEEVAAWIGELVAAGLVAEFTSSGEAYWHVTGWAKHQRIDKPTFKYPTPSGSNSPRTRRTFAESSASPRDGEEWRGEEGRGIAPTGAATGPAGSPLGTALSKADEIKLVDAGLAAVEAKHDDVVTCGEHKAKREPRKPKAAPTESKSAATSAAFAGAFLERYGTEPVRNAKVNAQLALLVQRLGADEAPKVAAFFVRQDGFYAERCHPVDLLLKDAESLRTKWATGRDVGSGPAPKGKDWSTASDRTYA